MNYMKFLVAATSVAACSVLTQTASFAQNVVVFGGSGSSALFNTLARAARTAGFANGGTYTIASGNASAGFVNDPTTTVAERGNLFVSWSGTAGSRRIVYYLSVDSTVGVRAYQNNAALGTTGGGSFPAPSGNAITIPNFNTGSFPNDVALPADVETTIKSQPFNAGGTDIAPASALETTQRTFALGYSATNPIRSSYSTATVTPVAFNLSGRTSSLFNIGASPVVVFVNRTDAAAGGLGSSDANNINRFTLAGFYTGDFLRTSDIIPTSGLSEKFVTANQRELLSGTYVTFEFNVPQSIAVNSSQENGVAENPLNETNDTPGITGGRRRVVGTGQMISSTNTVANSLGYAFWSTGSFSANAAGNTKYLTVDGVEPLRDAYVNGVYPSGSDITFKNVRNGSYPIWAILRLVLPAAPAGDLAAFTGAISPDDVVPANELLVFRSFRGSGTISASNGIVTGESARGTDSGGAVFLINNEINFSTDTGLELTGFRQ
ncbi:MAG: hypothetical protein H7Y38_08830 [Armatimonadetes bacterium]|nr:hypothetical protein [Armatimonadota bacterium]